MSAGGHPAGSGPVRVRRRACSTAGCCSSPARAASARPASPPVWPCCRPSAAGAPWCARSTPRATWPTRSSAGRWRFGPRELAPHLWGMAMDTEESLKEYLRLQLKVPLLGRIGPVARTFDFVADAAPGVKEILTVGKLCYEVRERNYDLIVVDASATGHVVGQLAAPQAINELVKVGRVRDQTRWMVDILGDPAHHRGGDRVVARGDAGHRDPRAGRAAARRDRRAPGRGGGQPGAARAVRPRRGGGLRPPAPAHRGPGPDPGPGRRRLGHRHGRSRRARVGGRAARRRPAGRHAAAHPGRAPDPAARRAGPPRCRCSTCPTCSPGPTACGPPGRWPRPWPPSSTTEPMARPARGPRRPDRPRPRRPAPLEQLLAAKEIVVTCGSGGVGKTTTAAAAAAMAAAQLGGKVLVLTVDPARRLATALGPRAVRQRRDAGARRAVRRPPASSPGASCGRPCSTPSSRGTSWCSTHAPDAETRDAILANPLYQNITGKFVQSHDYIAMERLYEIHSSGRYDLIVVDTPPTRNALDFLEAPERMADFFSQPAAALAHRPVPVAARTTRRRSPSTRSPTASSARSSWATSPSSSSCSRRCTTASSSGPRPSPAPWPTGAPRSWW